VCREERATHTEREREREKGEREREIEREAFVTEIRADSALL